jgi:FMN phosphatase YigB (HAD superfamily)
MPRGWYGFDLDGTLAHMDDWVDADHIGEPIAPMVEKALEHIRDGYEVRIVTARAAMTDEFGLHRFIEACEAWCLRHLGRVVAITCCKDMGMIALYDDRAIQVESNTGRIIGE